MDDFERELKVGFLDEAAAAVEEAEQCFLQLESNSNDPDTIAKIFRLAHNLKGSSKAVGFDDMGEFTHHFENLLLKIKDGTLQVSAPIVNLLLKCLDNVKHMIETLRGDLEARFDSSGLLHEIEQAIQGNLGEAAAPEPEPHAQEAAPPPAPPAPPRELTLEEQFDAISNAQFGIDVPPASAFPDEPIPQPTDAADLEAAIAVAAAQATGSQPDAVIAASTPEAQAAKAQAAGAPATPAPAAAKPAPAPAPAAAKPAAAPAAGGAKKAAAPPDETIRISSSRLEKLLNFVGEMTILQAVLHEQAQSQESPLLRKTIGQLGKVGKEIQDLSMGLRMLPVKQTFQKMQRIVRDTAMALGKDIALTIQGDETEVDKTVLERIADPLVHLVRNSVDHGIENAERRKESGKNAQGQIILSARHAGGKLVIEVKDDGGGIDPAKIFKIACAKGIVNPNSNMSDKDKVHLIFAPGFSTKEVVTDVSGRGVGMDVVKTNIEEIGGEVVIETEVGKGSTFKIVLPLTLAIMDGMVVRTGDEKFVLPLYHVSESLKIDASNSRNTAVGRVLLLRGENLPIIHLSDMFKRKRTTDETIGMIVRSGGNPFVLAVHDIIGQFQIVTKPLAPELRNLRGVVGTTILGDGKPAMILEPNHFIHTDSHRGAA